MATKGFCIVGMTMATKVKVKVKNDILCLFSNVMGDICDARAILHRFATF